MSVRGRFSEAASGVITGMGIAFVLVLIFMGARWAAYAYFDAGDAHVRADQSRRVLVEMLGLDPDKATETEIAERAKVANQVLAILSAPAAFQGRTLTIDVGEGKTRSLSVAELVGVVAQERAAAVLQAQASAQGAGTPGAPAPAKR